jgi:hypothetical protein
LGDPLRLEALGKRSGEGLESRGQAFGCAAAIPSEADELEDSGGGFEALECQLQGPWVSLGCEPEVHIGREGLRCDIGYYAKDSAGYLVFPADLEDCLGLHFHGIGTGRFEGGLFLGGGGQD